MTTPAFAGVLVRWSQDYGFIRQVIEGPDGRETFIDRFVHVSAVTCGLPVVGCFARFDLAPGRNGRPLQATNAEFCETESPPLSMLAGKGGAS